MARPRTFDEDEVVAAARDAFWSRGYAATSLDDLTAATGLGKGSLYGAFGDKHSLFIRALDGYCTLMLDAAIKQLRGPTEGAHRRLAAYVRTMAALNTSDAELRGCLMAKTAAELAGSDAEVRKKVADTLTRTHAELAATISAAQHEGTIAPDGDSRRIASLLLAVVRGIEALHKGGVDDAIVADAADQAVQLLPRP